MAFTLGGTRQRDDFLNAAFRLGNAQKERGGMIYTYSKLFIMDEWSGYTWLRLVSCGHQVFILSLVEVSTYCIFPFAKMVNDFKCWHQVPEVCLSRCLVQLVCWLLKGVHYNHRAMRNKSIVAVRLPYKWEGVNAVSLQHHPNERFFIAMCNYTRGTYVQMILTWQICWGCWGAAWK